MRAVFGILTVSNVPKLAVSCRADYGSTRNRIAAVKGDECGPFLGENW
jgi:hypothetical protein